MTQLCEGRETSLAQLVGRYQNDIYRFCLHYLREVEHAREMTQETFLRVYVARDRFDASRKFKPWVLCIARNLCLNELKRKKAVPMESLETYASSSRDESGALSVKADDAPDARMVAAERREILAQALDSLPEDAREIMVLRFFQRLSAREIADTIGSTEGAVRTRVHRILHTLRDRIGTSLEPEL
jgi:RNA polymerase sigma-70 factor (ECF subfamily)